MATTSVTVESQLHAGLSRTDCLRLRNLYAGYLRKHQLTRAYAVDARPPHVGNRCGWTLWLVQLTPVHKEVITSDFPLTT